MNNNNIDKVSHIHSCMQYSIKCSQSACKTVENLLRPQPVVFGVDVPQVGEGGSDGPLC